MAARLPAPRPRLQRRPADASASRARARWPRAGARGPLQRSRWVDIGRCLRRFHHARHAATPTSTRTTCCWTSTDAGVADRLRPRRGCAAPAWWCDRNLVRLLRSLQKITDPLPAPHFDAGRLAARCSTVLFRHAAPAVRARGSARLAPRARAARIDGAPPVYAAAPAGVPFALLLVLVARACASRELLARLWRALWLRRRARRRRQPVGARGFGRRGAGGGCLIDALRAAFPGRAVVLTSATPAGRARAQRCAGRWRACAMRPTTCRGACARVAAPAAGAARDPGNRSVAQPACAPARGVQCRCCSPARAFRRARPRPGPAGRGCCGRLLARGVAVAAQSEADAERFATSAFPPPRSWSPATSSSIARCRRTTPPAVRACASDTLPGGRCGSPAARTRGRRRWCWRPQRTVAQRCPGAVLVLAPRHPPRFAEVAGRNRRGGLRLHPPFGRRAGARRAAGRAAAIRSASWWISTPRPTWPSSVAAWCRPVATICWSLPRSGCQSSPVRTSPTRRISRALLQDAGALTIVSDAAALAAAVAGLLGDSGARARQGAAARAAVVANRGALQRIVALVESVLR